MNTRVTKGELLNSIQTIQAVLSRKIPTINQGGCLFFAYYACEKLKQSNVKCHIAVKSNESHKGNLLTKGLNHAWVVIPKYRIAFDGLSYQYYERVPDYILNIRSTKDRQLILNALEKEDLWNDTYPRRLNFLVRTLIELLLT